MSPTRIFCQICILHLVKTICAKFERILTYGTEKEPFRACGGDVLLGPSTPKIEKLKKKLNTNLILRLDLKTKTYGSANPDITYSEVRPKDPKKWPFLAKKKVKIILPNMVSIQKV